MNKLKNYIIILGMAVIAISCVKPEDPSPTNMAYGTWRVAEYYVNNQEAGSSVIQRFVLERDGSFLLEDNNGILTYGTWDASESKLVLTEADTASGGTVYDFDVLFQSYTKMHLLQTIASPTVGDIQIRYLMNWLDDGRYYGNDD